MFERKIKVLVVDDDAATRLTLRRIIESSEQDAFEILEAANGTECLMALERQGPVDLILLDVQMPDLDGFSICRAIRTVDAVVPIVFVSAFGDLKDRATGRKVGSDSFLVKPVQPSHLLSLVNLLTRTRKWQYKQGRTQAVSA